MRMSIEGVPWLTFERRGDTFEFFVRGHSIGFLDLEGASAFGRGIKAGVTQRDALMKGYEE